jgi:hypothetical protein
MDLRRQGSLGARGSMEPRRQGSLGARGPAELRPDKILVEFFSARPDEETLVESFSATHREGRTGSCSILRATTIDILALSVTITAPFGSDIMKSASGEDMLMMSVCEVSSDGVLLLQNVLDCFFYEKRKMRSSRKGQSNAMTKVSKDQHSMVRIIQVPS